MRSMRNSSGWKIPHTKNSNERTAEKYHPVFAVHFCAGVHPVQDAAAAPVHHALFILSLYPMAALQYVPRRIDERGLLFRPLPGLLHAYSRTACRSLRIDRLSAALYREYAHQPGGCG